METKTRQPEPSQETTSLVKRLAGPSTTKAGLAKDQTGINRIIAEASKGSKFYENEKRKDKELTERITRILKQRDEALQGVDIRKIEVAVDQQLAELESKRDLSQIIVHVDMDAFYANVELLDNPELEGKAFGVGSGVLTTASYEARKFGVRSGMPGFIAKKLCPEIILVKPHFSRYFEMSSKVMEIFRRYDPQMCPAGADEGYLNITACCQERNLTADDCVEEMRSKVREETGLTVSAGIAPNTMLAKICSDKNKPNGQFKLPFYSDSILAFMRDLSIRKIPGIGRVNERLLESIGIKSCGDIYANRATLCLMDKQFGLTFLLRTYLGIASNAVEPSKRQERKSIGYERTFSPMSDKAAILRKLEQCAEGLEADMKENGWAGKTVTLKFKLDTYEVFTRAKSFNRWVTKKEELFDTGKELLQPEWPLKLRLIGLRVTKLRDLQVPAEEKSSGIKRFFEPINAPSKRPKLVDDVEAGHDDQEVLHHYDDDEPESMPGFHEEEEGEGMGATGVDHMCRRENDSNGGDDDEDVSEAGPWTSAQGSRPRPPTSATAGASTNARRLSRSTRSPSRPPSPNHPSAARPPQSKTSASAEVTPSVRGARKNDERSGIGQRPDSIAVQEAPTEQQSCPVCLKSLLMDNREFNAHIDFCLSRSAIRDAQAEAAGRTAGGDKGTISRRWASSSIGKGYGKGHERTTKKT